MYENMKFPIFFIGTINKTRIPDRYLKLLYLSIPKLSGTSTEIIWNRYLYIFFIKKPEPNRNNYFIL